MLDMKRLRIEWRQHNSPSCVHTLSASKMNWIEVKNSNLKNDMRSDPVISFPYIDYTIPGYSYVWIKSLCRWLLHSGTPWRGRASSGICRSDDHTPPVQGHTMMQPGAFFVIRDTDRVGAFKQSASLPTTTVRSSWFTTLDPFEPFRCSGTPNFSKTCPNSPPSGKSPKPYSTPFKSVTSVSLSVYTVSAIKCWAFIKSLVLLEHNDLKMICLPPRDSSG